MKTKAGDTGASLQKISPCLWFNFNAEEAVDHYLGIFKSGRVLEVQRYGEAMPGLAGKVLMIRFELAGQVFQALNGGPQFPFTEAVSLSVDCDDQTEVDRLWQQLTADGGQESACGWLKDKFGLSWQIVPRQMLSLLNSPDSAAAKRAMQALMTMRKIDVDAMQQAFDAVA